MACELGRSVKHQTPAGEQLFPAYNDLAQSLVDMGEIASAGDLLGTRSDLLPQLFLRWIKEGQLGCRFAVSLAMEKRQPPWHMFVLPEPGDRVAWAIEDLVAAAPADAEAIFVFLLGVHTPEALVQVLRHLVEHPSWTCEEVDWKSEHPTLPDRCLVGLKWSLPDGEHRAEVLGFAPFESMPFTRRVEGAPFSVLAFRHRWPPENPDGEFGNPDRREVHLANLPFPEDLIERFREATRTARRDLLGDEIGAARARVTFCLPEALSAALFADMVAEE